MTRFFGRFFVVAFGLIIAVSSSAIDFNSLASSAFAQGPAPQKQPATVSQSVQGSSSGRAGSTVTAPKATTAVPSKATMTAPAASAQLKSPTATTTQPGSTQSNTSTAPAITTNPSATPLVGIPNNDSASALQLQRVEKYLLKYKFAKGEILRTKVTQQTRVDTTIGGSSNVAEVATISQKSWRVVEVDKDGAVTFETQWDKIDMRQKMSRREEVRFNSETDKDPPAGYEATAASIGIPLSHLTISSNGKLLNREIKSNKAKPFMDDKATYQATQQLLVRYRPSRL